MYILNLNKRINSRLNKLPLLAFVCLFFLKLNINFLFVNKYIGETVDNFYNTKFTIKTIDWIKFKTKVLRTNLTNVPFVGKIITTYNV